VIPTPQIVISNLQVNEDESIHFEASSSDSPSDGSPTYVWDFGDDSNSPGTVVDHTYSEMGIYTVTLTVSDGKITNSTQVEIQVDNLPPTANAGTPKNREATVGSPVLFDASQSLETELDLKELNYTWKIGEDRAYGEIIDYAFDTTGTFPVILEVRDNNGALSEDTLTFEVSKASESGDEEVMGTVSWILVLIIIVFLGVIGFLVHALQDEKLYKEMKAEEVASGGEIIVGEEIILVEGVVDDDSFKPKEITQEQTVEVTEEQGAEVEVVVEGETNHDTFKPPDDAQKTTEEVPKEKDQKIVGTHDDTNS